MHGLQPWGEVQWKESHTLNPSPTPPPKEKAKIVFWRYLSYTICICQAPAMPLPGQPWGWHLVVASLMTSFSGWWRWAAGQHAFIPCSFSLYQGQYGLYIVCMCESREAIDKVDVSSPYPKPISWVHTGTQQKSFYDFFFSEQSFACPQLKVARVRVGLLRCKSSGRFCFRLGKLAPLSFPLLS